MSSGNGLTMAEGTLVRKKKTSSQEKQGRFKYAFSHTSKKYGKCCEYDHLLLCVRSKCWLPPEKKNKFRNRATGCKQDRATWQLQVGFEITNSSSE